MLWMDDLVLECVYFRLCWGVIFFIVVVVVVYIEEFVGELYWFFVGVIVV